MAKTDILRVEEREGERTKLIVDHCGEDLVFLHQAYGPDHYANVKGAIEQNSLRAPNMAQTTSLVHAAFNSKDKYSNEIKDIMKKRLLWAFTILDYRPNIGAFIYDEGDRKEFGSLSVKELESRLGAEQENGAAYGKDRKLWHAPFGYATGRMSSYELARNPFVTALAKGGEGTEKLAEVASKFRFKPILFSFDDMKEQTTRVSALESIRGFGGRLFVRGDIGVRYGYAFGVSKNGEANQPKE